MHTGQISVLAYHGVDDVENFDAQMEYVARHYRPISLGDLDRAVHASGSLPDRSVLVTFDDGHRSVLENALPVLTRRGIPAVVFVVAGLIQTTEDFWWSKVQDLVRGGGRVTGLESLTSDELVRRLKTVTNSERLAAIAELESSAGRKASPRQQLTEQQLIELESGGVAIGNHTWTHPCLNRCEADTVRIEVTRAHERLSDILRAPPISFAYPNGDWDEIAERLLVEHGYRLGFMFDHRHAGPASDPLRLSRLRVNSDTRMERFATILSGLHPAIHHARGRS
jgi:peptidoglycan/xylan/chitin deacetylase (PgdA/CDA1 family)